MTGLDYSAAFDALPVACAVLSPELVYVSVNRAYERERGQLLGRRSYEVFPGGRLGDIVGDLLELARLEGGAPFVTEPVDLSALVAAEVERADPACRTVVDIAPGVMVEGSPVRLARVLANLLGNADRHAVPALLPPRRRPAHRPRRHRPRPAHRPPYSPRPPR
ncbi:PAS domain-containing protein [Actinomadura nitritigenes]|uniref:PAS domain-containing protein n=1 Tax=Actinomadura nitritigenes TaxID=134602 RepID=UPI00367C4BC7